MSISISDPDDSDSSMRTSSYLINNAKEGNQQSWAEIVNMYSPIVNATFKCKNIPHQEWPILRNEVWLRLFRWLPNFRKEGTGSFRKSLRTLSGRVVASHFEGESSQKSQTVDDESWAVVDAESATETFKDLEDSIDLHELIEALLHMLEKQSDQRTMAVLRLSLEGNNAPAIGRSLGISPEVVRQVRSSAYSRLRLIARDYYGFDPLRSNETEA